MKLPLWQVDAFASRRFEGNPAAVVPLEAWLPDAVLQAIAAENNLADTAYLVPHGDDYSMAYDQAYIASEALRMRHNAIPFFQDLLSPDYWLNAVSELPQAEDWSQTRLIFGCGSAKPHTSNHPAFSLR